jgi:hypothetical protein
MKNLNFTFPRLALIVFLSGLKVFSCMLSLRAEVANSQVQQAEVLRSISVTKIGPTGFSEGQISLQKGSFYDVEKIVLSNVFINVEGQLVRVPRDDVSISKKVVREADPITGFVPGKIVLLNASYGLPTARPIRNSQTLRALQNMIPRNEITKPVEVLITDALLGAQANAQTVVSSSSGNIDYNGNFNMTTQTQKAQKNVLQVEYQYNGEKLKKSALEESVLILP